MPSFDPGVAGTITAVLGPTNTGKTHLAIQRMLGHRTGMIGLPLRLLAREVYDRVVEARGADQVALVTGEEKIVPLQPRYWVCTVESMPVDRPVAFVAVDEVQLAGDPGRGHVFTDRILHLRGAAETWFLGSDTIEPLLTELVPTVQVRSQPRLSRLSYAGPRKVTALPPRTAIVAFSMARVYELGERLRQRHGGAAIVLGALSPRARNAQVELFQSGEVQHVVATDAIGMGLNMDVHHVALAGLQKFDGRSLRRLRDDELAQIAGRAGRWRRDGTFGETAGIDPLDGDVVEALEHHRFPPLTQLYWRHRDLDFSGPDALRASLDVRAPRRFLVPVRDADDARALARLLELPEVRRRLGAPARLRLLWDVCGVPDFGKVSPEHHAGLLEQLFVRLVDHDGALPDGFFEEQVRRLDRADGDIDTLMGRIAGIRIWTYVANRPGWVRDPRDWQERTRALEDRVSDALHRRLTARFVDHRAAVLVRHLEGGEEEAPVLLPSGEVRLGGERLGTLRGLGLELASDATASPRALRAARKLIAPLLAARLEALEGSPDGAFGVDPDGGVRWDGAVVGRLVAGDDWRRPKVRPLRHDGLEGDQRGRLAARLDAWAQRWLAALVAPLRTETETPAAKGLLYVLEQGLGAVPVGEVRDLLARLDERARSELQRAGVRIGRRAVLHPRVIERTDVLATLWRVHHGAPLELPDDGGVLPVRGGLTREQARVLGFARAGDWLVRVDVLEALLAGGEAEARARGVPEAAWGAVAAILRERAAGPPPRGRSRRPRSGRGRRRPKE